MKRALKSNEDTSESLEGVRFQLGDDFTLHLTLDDVICRKRDLRQVILETAEQIMRELASSKKASIFEIYQSKLDNIWDYLREVSDPQSVRFLIAAASPKLNFIKLEIMPEQALKVSWHHPEHKTFSATWLGVSIRRFERQESVNFGLVSAQFDALAFKIASTGQLPDGEFCTVLKPLQFERQDDLSVAFSEDFGEAFVRIPTRLVNVEDLKNELKFAARRVCIAKSDSYAVFADAEITAFCERVRAGDLQNAYAKSEIVFVCGVRPNKGTFSRRNSQLIPGVSAPNLFDPYYEPVSGQIELLMNECRKHLNETSSEQRFFSHMAFTFDIAKIRDVFSYAANCFNQLQSNINSSETTFTVGLQILPILTLQRIADIQADVSGGRKPWLKSILRETAVIGGLNRDFETLSRSMLVKVSSEDIEKAVSQMTKAKLLCFDEKSQVYKASTSQIQTEEQVSGAAIFEFYNSIFALTSDLTRELPLVKLFWAWKKIPWKTTDLQKLQEFCNRTTKGLMDLEFGCENRNSVFQACLQVIPARIEPT